MKTSSLIADARKIQTIHVSETVQLDGTASYGEGMNFHCLFKSTHENSQTSLSRVESNIPSIIADQEGTYVLQLHIVNIHGEVDNDIVSIQDCQACHSTTSWERI